MMRVIFVGSPSAHYRSIEEDLVRKLRMLMKIEIFQVAEKSLPADRRLKEEAKRIDRLLKGKSYVTDPKGILINDDFMLSIVKRSLYEDISIVVGGPYGVSPSVRGERISFSKLIFTHDLFRIMLLEQIYRQTLAIKGVRYKK